MCYNTRQSRMKKELEKILSVKAMYGDDTSELELIYFHANGWAHPIMWAIMQEEPEYLLPNMWGIMPSNQRQRDHGEYFKNPRTFGGLNARSEKLFDHFIYKHSWKNQRCLIPVDGFFEPHNTGVKVKGKDFKVPFYFKMKDDSPLYLAGIYTNTIDGGRTFTVLTKEATPLFELIHNEKKRRPVIIPRKNLDAWLSPKNNESDVMELLSDDLLEGELSTYPVSRDLYSRRMDTNYPEIIERVDYPEISINFHW